MPTALVTGGAVRLGRGIALGLASRGFDLAIHYNSSRDPAEATAVEARKLGCRAECFPCDFQKAEDVSGFISRVEENLSTLDLLVNSASAYESGRIAQTTDELLFTQFQVNLFAPLQLTRQFASGKRSGHVINILDNKIRFHQYDYTAYLLAKKSLAELTKMAALEFAPSIRVNGIAPGVILPAESRSADYIDWRVQGIPLKKQGAARNINQAVDYLLDNDFVSGEILFVDGAESSDRVGQNAVNYQAESGG